MQKNIQSMEKELEDAKTSLRNNYLIIEEEAKHTYQNVADSVEKTKEQVLETAQKVKNTFDLKLQVEKHPMEMVAGSVLVGFVVGEIGSRKRGPQAKLVGGSTQASDSRDRLSHPFLSELASQFREELDLTRNLLVASALEYVAQRARRDMPKWGGPIEKICVAVSNKMASKPPVIPADSPASQTWRPH